MSGAILVLNAGSSSIKMALFDPQLTPVLTGGASGIGGALSKVTLGTQEQALPLATHAQALQAILSALADRGIALTGLRAAAHRVVHGGAALTGPRRVTPQVRAEIAACAPLAPLHNPHNLAAIDALAALAPDLPQFASFDTSFHATNPAVATRYAIPDTAETQGIRRYGFHGLSYASLVDTLPRLTGQPLPTRLLALHLGNGASLCAIRDGQSVATTMGYSPLDGLTMGTRSGGIDANAVLHMVEAHGLARTRAILNNESGLVGLSGGTSDMRQLMQVHTPGNDFAVAHFCYWTLRHAGGLIAAMEGVDAIAFTGGIGENAAEVRARIAAGLAWLGLRLDPEANRNNRSALHSADSPIQAWVVPAQEERQIAADALRLLNASA